MEQKSIDLVSFFSGAFATLSMLGVAVLSFGPWSSPQDPVGRTLLWISFLAFGMIHRLASSVGRLLITQADAIAALQRELDQARSGS